METNTEEYQIRLKRFNSEVKNTRNGVLIFLIIHLLFEILTDNSKTAVPLVLANFFISMWYIKYILKKNHSYTKFMLLGLSVAAIVFLIRLLLGLAVYYFITK